MTGEREMPGAAWYGVAVAVALSGAFVGLLFLVSPLVAALVVVPASIGVGALRARAVPRGAAHCLVEPSFDGRVVIAAPMAASAATTLPPASTGTPSAA
jgi:hypothetical protein